ALQVGFVRDRTDDVAGLHAMAVADFDAVGLHARFRRTARRDVLARGARGTGAAVEGRALSTIEVRPLAAIEATTIVALRALAAVEPFGALRTFVARLVGWRQQRRPALHDLRQRGGDVGDG